MKMYGKAEGAATRILEAFKAGTVPAALAPIFIKSKADIPCRSWSVCNQLLTALAGHSDARGFRQWQDIGRSVRKGERAFQILAPCVRKVETIDDTGERSERGVVYGFRAVSVFGLEQTEGEPISQGDPALDKWIGELPILGVAQSWGISVEAFNGADRKPCGWFSRGGSIALGVQNLSTWAHEMIHAADHRLGNLKERGQHWRSETVAELGGAVLLECLGLETVADRGGCWDYVKHYAKAADIEPIAACQDVLKRTCEAVSLILETAQQLAEPIAA